MQSFYALGDQLDIALYDLGELTEPDPASGGFRLFLLPFALFLMALELRLFGDL